MFIDYKHEIKSESNLQVAVIEFCYKYRADYPGIDDFFHCPNGGGRTKAQGAKLKLEGVKKGVPDLIWMIPNNGYHGLCIELKWGKGKPTKEQIEWLAKRQVLGYKTAICYTLYDACFQVAQYFEIHDREVLDHLDAIYANEHKK